MGRSEQKSLNANAAQANALSQEHTAKANTLYSTLAPALTNEINNPQGFAKGDLDTMRTSSMQGIGGSTAGVVGQGNLEAARTRNVGGNSAALDEAARAGDRQFSEGNLNIDANNAKLKEAQRQSGMMGLQGLYGGLDSASLNALGLSSDAYSKASQAYQNPTVALLTAAMQGAGQGAGLAAGCWIADALYGVGSFKATVLRWWLNSVFKHTWFGGMVMALYLKHGESVAGRIKANWWVGLPFRPVFWLAWQFALPTFLMREGDHVTR